MKWYFCLVIGSLGAHPFALFLYSHFLDEEEAAQELEKAIQIGHQTDNISSIYREKTLFME